MDAYLIEWGSFLLRWLHVITGIAWIGASFFFMHLDASLRASPTIPAGQGAVSWHVHGGGFYEMNKYYVAPASLPADLIWHKWQAYWTWISGFFLLIWVYYAQASLYLIDPMVMPLSTPMASAIGLGGIAAGWIIYDALCKSPLGRNENVLAALGLGLVILASYGFSQVFSGRGAMIHTGALMATIMSGNVFFIIMPNQRKVIATLQAGGVPDAKYGKQAKQRSTHNNYITLPVLFTMLSNHYPVFWANNATIPLIVGLMTVAGALVRHFYNVSHANHAKSPYWAWVVAALLVLIAFYVAMAASPGGRERLGMAAKEERAVNLAGLTLPPEPVVEIITGRCAMCHAAEPVWDGIQIAPKGVLLDTPARIAQQAGAIHAQAVITHAMPPNNITELSKEDRRILAQWLGHKPVPKLFGVW